MLFISSELEEVVRTSQRVVVLKDRRKIAELTGADITESAVMRRIADATGAENRVMISSLLFWGVFAGLLFVTAAAAALAAAGAGAAAAVQPVLHAGFFDLKILDGHLYGTRIDILNHGAKVMLLALGMTLVYIATGEVDLSVGAIMAIAGAVVAQLVVAQGVSAPAALAAALECRCCWARGTACWSRSSASSPSSPPSS
ncbi:MAG: hypothetical protein U1G05_18230 [Kiritimatiellia bacterium]